MLTPHGGLGGAYAAFGVRLSTGMVFRAQDGTVPFWRRCEPRPREIALEAAPTRSLRERDNLEGVARVEDGIRGAADV